MLDPEATTPVEARVLDSMMRLIKVTAAAADHDPAIAEALVGQVGDGLHRFVGLPEVGAVSDGEGVRLWLHALYERLADAWDDPSNTLPPPPVTQPTGGIGSRPIRRASRSAARLDDDLARFAVPWDEISLDVLDLYDRTLAAATNERPLQQVLTAHPMLLIQHLGGGHGRWVMPQLRFGSEYVADFVVGEKDSDGFHWTFVELQSPHARMFVPSSGRNSPQFDEGLRQIAEWRRWIDDNRPYARQRRAQNGLGLDGISGSDQGLLIIGREAELTEQDKERRRQLQTQLRVEIHTYDWLTREAKRRIVELATLRRPDAGRD